MAFFSVNVQVFVLIFLAINVACQDTEPLTVNQSLCLKNQKLCLRQIATVFNNCQDYQTCVTLAFYGLQRGLDSVWNPNQAALEYYNFLEASIEPTGNMKTPQEYCNALAFGDYSDIGQPMHPIPPEQSAGCSGVLHALYAGLSRQEILEHVYEKGSNNYRYFQANHNNLVVIDPVHFPKHLVNYVMHVGTRMHIGVGDYAWSPIQFCRSSEWNNYVFVKPVDPDDVDGPVPVPNVPLNLQQ